MRSTAAALRRAAGRQLSSRYTIAHLSGRTFLSITVAAVVGLLIAAEARAQGAASPADSDAYAKGRWRVEFLAQAALEAWNYNPSHEELYGLTQGVTYGLRDGLVLIARQRLFYV